MNVVDEFRGLSTEEIRNILDGRRQNFSVLFENTVKDLNLGNSLRNAGCFGARQVIIVGSRRYDRRSTVGAHCYQNFVFLRNIEEVKDWQKANNSVFIGIDNVPGSRPMESFKWNLNRHTVMCFGNERNGVHPDILEICESVLAVRMIGATRSLNVATTCGITLYDYTLKSSPLYPYLSEKIEKNFGK